MSEKLKPYPFCGEAAEISEPTESVAYSGGREIVRCDYCDNGIEPEWEFCAWCSRVLKDETGKRHPSPSGGWPPPSTGDGERVREALESLKGEHHSREWNGTIEVCIKAALSALSSPMPVSRDAVIEECAKWLELRLTPHLPKIADAMRAALKGTP